MKILVAVLSILVALLAFAFWKRDSSATASLADAGLALAAVSNKLADASMQVTHQEQLAAVARSGLDDRARQLTAMSNTVATLNVELAKSRVETVAARAGAQDLQARVAAADAQTAGLTGKVEELTAQIRSLKLALEEARNNATQLESERAALANEAECLKIEKFELARQWNDPRALLLQRRHVKARKQPLALELNGSVSGAGSPPRGGGDPGGQPHP